MKKISVVVFWVLVVTLILMFGNHARNGKIVGHSEELNKYCQIDSLMGKSGLSQSIIPKKNGGTIKLPLYSEPQSFNPYIDESVAKYLFLQPYRISAYDGSLVSVMVDSLTPESGDSLKWILKLKDSLLWSDSSKITSYDFCATVDEIIKRIVLPLDTTQFLNSAILSVKPLDSLHVAITLQNKFGELKHFLTFPLLPRKLCKKIKNNELSSILSTKIKPESLMVSGPFIIADYIPYNSVRLARNRLYYRKNLPNIDTLILSVVPEMLSVKESFLLGDLDCFEFNSEEPDSVISIADSFSVTPLGPSYGALYLFMNPNADSSKSILYSVENRRALRSAFPLRNIIDTIFSEHCFLGLNLYNPSFMKGEKLLQGISGRSEPDSLVLKKLSEASDGKVLSICYYSGSAEKSLIADLIVSTLSKFNIRSRRMPLSKEKLRSILDGTPFDWDLLLVDYFSGSDFLSLIKECSDFSNLGVITNLDSVWNFSPSKLFSRIKTDISNEASVMFSARVERYAVVASNRVGNVQPSVWVPIDHNIDEWFVK